MKIQFCGAATSVTGSCHLITVGNYKILMDCGQFQGNKAMEAENYAPFPFNPAEIDFMVLSHAHIDHCGRIPLLVKRGFKGNIYCTDATGDLLEIMLKDSGYIHEKEAEWQNRKNQRAGRAFVEPLYTFNDAVDSLKYIKPVMYDQLIEPIDGIKVVFNEAGHILGSAITEIFIEEEGNTTKIVFSGDLGVMNRPILRDPKIIKKADYLIVEATYGNRLHEKNSTSVDALKEIVLKTIARGGNVVIPSFAVGRTQELIFEFNKLYEHCPEFAEKMKDVYVYIDSPMATAATETFKRNAQVYDDEMRKYLLACDNPLDFANLKYSKTSDESKRINMDAKPKIIISASGMCEAGRIRHHLKHNLWNKKSSIVFVGYQAEGTLGRYLINGTDAVTLFGEEIKVNAEIHNLEGFSGHADRDGLTDWLSGLEKAPKQIFIVHGEQDAKVDFAAHVKQTIGYDCTVIQDYSEYILEENSIVVKTDASVTVDDEELQHIKNRLANINKGLQNILYNTHLAFNEDMQSDRIVQIKNAILELEKNSLNLSSIVTKEDRAQEPVKEIEE